MTAEVTEMPGMNERKQNVELARQRSIEKLFTEAGELREKLVGSTRYHPEWERERFARNLGEITERVCRQLMEAGQDVDRFAVLKAAIAGIYKVNVGQVNPNGAAVSSGAKSALSLWRHRQRYVRFADEKAKGKIATTLRPFVEIAEELLALSPDSSDPALKKSRATINLVEGTTYDKHFVPGYLIKHNEREEFCARLEDLLKKVKSSPDVDLDGYWANSMKYPMTVIERDADRNLSKVGRSDTADLSLGVDCSVTAGAEDQETRLTEAHEFAIRVKLGYLYVPCAVELTLPVVCPDPPVLLRTDDHDLMLQARRAFESALIETYGKEIKKAFVGKQRFRRDWNRLKHSFQPHAQELHDWIKRNRPTAETPVVWDRFEVFLSIEKERSSGEWRLFLGCHIPSDYPEMDRVVQLGETAERDAFLMGWQLHSDAPAEHWPFGALVPIPVPDSNVVTFAYALSAHDHVHPESHLFYRTLRANGALGLDLALRRAVYPQRAARNPDGMAGAANPHFCKDWIFRPIIDDAPGNGVGVSEQSIAGAIIRSMLFAADEEHKLHFLLAEDARRKSRLVNKSVEAEARRYAEAVARYVE